MTQEGRMVNFHYIDCMEFMANVPDKAYKWVVADIPYGIGVGKMAYLTEMNTTVKQKNGTYLNANKNKTPYIIKDWDSNTPTQAYFDEAVRVSENQIIFGINYVDWKGVGKGRIKWNKGFAKGISFNKYEYAYCSSIEDEIEIEFLWAGMMQAKSLKEPMTQQGNKNKNEKRIHPTHKPVRLYSKIFIDIIKEPCKILDTHGGGMSVAIASDELGFDIDICEIDKDYFTDGFNRFTEYKRQLKLFHV